jgi:hypothetical protein
MRRLIAAVLAAFAVGLTLAVIGLPQVVPAGARPLRPDQATPTPPVSRCEPSFDKVAAPGQLLLGSEVTITLTARVACPAARLHIVLVLPESADVPAEELNRIQESAEQLVESLKLPEHPDDKVGVVAYSGTSRTLCQLTNDERRLRACIRQLGSTGATAIDKGIDEGRTVLTRGRPVDAAVEAREIMVVYAGSHNTAGCDPVLRSASKAKSQMILMMTVCAGNDCDVNCMRQVATSPRYYFEVGDVIVPPRGGPDVTTTVRRLTISDTLPPDMAYIPGSANPPPDHDVASASFTWQFNMLPLSGVTVTLRVRPAEVGERPTNLVATGELLDSTGAYKKFVFPVPMVRVLPEPTATPTATPSPTPMCTPPPCPCGVLVGSCPNIRCEACTATSTPTPRPKAYLPWTECGR